VQIAPNPFSKVTQILFKLKKESKITVDVFSLDGKLVQTIFSGTQTEGKHSITLDATSAGMANGRYILRITEGKNSAFEQVIKVD
jgi:flagellar hook assembly protein FlgD